MTDDNEEQRLAALARANAMRHARAELKRQIADGTVFLAELLLAPPDPALGCSLGVLVRSQRGWGRQKTAALLRRIDIADGKTIGDLTPRQRAVAADQLR